MMASSLQVDAPDPASQHNETLSDAQLVAAINEGDYCAFEQIYYRYRDWVLGLAWRFTHDPDISLDVLQETFLYFLKKFPGFRLTANLKTFLYPAVRNLSITACEKTRRYQATEAELFEIEQAAAASIASESLSDLNAIISQTPEEQREVLLLRFVDGLSLAGIA